MSLYVNPDALEARLPTDAFTSDELVSFVTRASGYVDDNLPNYWGFPAYNDTIATPQLIQDCALDYAVYLARGDLGEDNEQAENTSPMARLERCDRILKGLRQGPPEGPQISQVQVTTEALTFGTDPDHPSWAILAFADVEVMVDSAEITTADGEIVEVGVDFILDLASGKRRWYVERKNPVIVDDDTISYRFSYIKGRERTGSLAAHGGTLSRA